MNSNKKTARIAGLLYLVVVVTGIFNLAYVPGKLIVWDDATATFNNITNSETLFRLGMLSAIICYIFFLFLPLTLYKLLNTVNKNHALAMVILAVVSVPISLVNLLHKYEILNLISKADYLKIFGTEQLQAQVLLHLQAYNNGNQIASIFWGLWLFPFGYLVFKSGFLPKILGVLLIAGCFSYLIKFVGHFLLPGYDETAISGFITLPASIGEIGTCLWLLIMGAKDNRS